MRIASVITVSLLTAALGGVALASAQSISAAAGVGATASSSATSFVSPAHPIKPTCITLDTNLSYGTQATGSVTALQAFLYARGYFSVPTTGPFGPLTLAAVKHFQADSDVPTTGFVGPLTRAAMQRNCSTGSVSIQSITPSSGTVGSTVTIAGSGFTSDNTIHFGSGVIAHVAAAPAIYNCPMMPAGSTGGCGSAAQTLTFTVPNALDPACTLSVPRCEVASRLTTPGQYSVTVENSAGTSAPVTFTVTATDTDAIAPVIYSITPTAGPVGTTVTIDGRAFSDSNIIHFGGGSIGNVPVTSSIAIACSTDPSCVPGIHQTLTFTVPNAIGAYCKAGEMCPMFMQLVTPGSYAVSVENDTGASNSTTFTVTSGTATGAAPTISSISPSVAQDGQTVTIVGSGFSSGASLDIYQNGQPYGSLGNLTVVNDSTATFTVPQWIGAYCHFDAVCIMIAKNWPAGSYTVSVENKNGESNQGSLTIGAGSSSGQISVTGLDAPATLAMGTSGTWTVHASEPSTTGQLHYAVNWGDAANTTAMGFAIPQTTTIQTSATFTHAYAGAGTYTPVFTVTDDAGHSATVSSTITITPWY